MRPCLNCGRPTPQTRCSECEARKQTLRNARRTHYHGDYRRRARQVRTEAERCWLCGDGPRPDDPWQADHVTPGDPNSLLLPAHRSCNARRGNTA